MLSRILYSLLLILPAAVVMAQPEISVDEMKTKTENTDGVVLIDVRTPEEVQEGHIKGARNIDVDARNFKRQVKGLDKSLTYYLYCGTGVRSSRAARIMIDMGFDSVYSVKGGIKAWKSAGYPIE
ncbi:MAG: rhodanese-like domain-containing protein [Cyclobacteriaceae bacterium]|jgi:rhodanese-related sulfurtransferase|nr:rhodanese-like domain-containing protein [Cyclobacteriaceae bacterium]